MALKYILSIDSGTTNCKCVIFDSDREIAGKSFKHVKSYFPEPGYVEQNPYEVISAVRSSIRAALKDSGLSYNDINSIAITNQRESTILWNKRTGKAVYNALIWQDRRSGINPETLKSGKRIIKNRTGLRPDPYFSAGKIAWIINNIPGVKELMDKNELAAGTYDSWILYNLTNGGSFYTDVTNASRTMVFNIKKLDWDDRLMEIFGLNRSIFPEVKASSGYFGDALFNSSTKIGINSMIGDQQSSLAGHGALKKGMVKNTYGTGSFLLMNTGNEIISSENLISTVAYSIDGAPASYAIEGSIFNSGSILEWLRELFSIKSFEALENSAKEAKNKDVFIVPAFSGLGAPYWNESSRGIIAGITRGTSRNDIINSGYEAIAFQVNDIINEMKKYIEIKKLGVDGGPSKSSFLMQLQSDISKIIIERASSSEITAAGAAYMAGIGSGIWSLKDNAGIVEPGTKYTPDKIDYSKKFIKWKEAAERSLNWASIPGNEF